MNMTTTVTTPTIVCLCGSTRFSEAFRVANLQETLAGKIVLSIGCDFKGDDALGLGEADKACLDALHLRKIELADEVLILNVEGCVGESTSRELVYALKLGKRVRWLEEEYALHVSVSGEEVSPLSSFLARYKQMLLFWSVAVAVFVLGILVGSWLYAALHSMSVCIVFLLALLVGGYVASEIMGVRPS